MLPHYEQQRDPMTSPFITAEHRQEALNNKRAAGQWRDKKVLGFSND